MKTSKKQVQSEETREKIQQVSTRLLITRSYNGTTISAIANEVGLTKGALYHHYKSKEELVLEIVKTVKTSWFRNVGRKVLTKNTSIDQLYTLFNAHSQYLKHDQTICLLMSSLLAEKGILNTPIINEIKEVYSAMLSFIQNIIEQGQNTGELKSELHAKNTAFTIVGMLRWMGCSPMFDLLGFKLEGLAENTFKLIVESMIH